MGHWIVRFTGSGENPDRKDYQMTVGLKLKFKTIVYIYKRKNLSEKIEHKKIENRFKINKLFLCLFIFIFFI